MLRATHRVLRPGGQTIFTIVHPTEAGRHGPDRIDQPTGEEYAALTADAGFDVTAVDDLTDEYLRVAGAWVESAADLEPELRAALGDDVYDHRVDDRHSAYQRVVEARTGRVRLEAIKA